MQTTQTQQVVRLPKVLEMTGISKGSVYAFVKNGTFPKQIRLGPKAIGWLVSEVQSWIADRANARSAK